MPKRLRQIAPSRRFNYFKSTPIDQPRHQQTNKPRTALRQSTKQLLGVRAKTRRIPPKNIYDSNHQDTSNFANQTAAILALTVQNLV